MVVRWSWGQDGDDDDEEDDDDDRGTENSDEEKACAIGVVDHADSKATASGMARGDFILAGFGVVVLNGKSPYRT